MRTVAEVRSFEAFFREEYLAVVSLCAWLTGDRAVGEDLAQEAMTTAHRRWAEVAGYERPGTFVRRVAINLASNERRRRARHDGAVRRLRALQSHHGEPTEDAQGLWRAVAELPLQQRAAVALRYLEDCSTAQIAEALDCAESTVRVHLHRAHRRLAERLGLTTDSVEPVTEGGAR